jgi:hypothetical protein
MRPIVPVHNHLINIRLTETISLETNTQHEAPNTACSSSRRERLFDMVKLRRQKQKQQLQHQLLIHKQEQLKLKAQKEEQNNAPVSIMKKKTKYQRKMPKKEDKQSSFTIGASSCTSLAQLTSSTNELIKDTVLYATSIDRAAPEEKRVFQGHQEQTAKPLDSSNDSDTTLEPAEPPSPLTLSTPQSQTGRDEGRSCKESQPQQEYLQGYFKDSLIKQAYDTASSTMVNCLASPVINKNDDDATFTALFVEQDREDDRQTLTEITI